MYGASEHAGRPYGGVCLGGSSGGGDILYRARADIHVFDTYLPNQRFLVIESLKLPDSLPLVLQGP